MLAARLGPRADIFAVEEVPLPAVKKDECLVRVHACGICASDLHIIAGVTPTPYRPITLGHEAAGVVVATGEDAQPSMLGMRVFINPILVCGACRACRGGRTQICAQRKLIGIHREGALAQYVAVPERNLLPLAEEVTFSEAAIIESASTPYHALTSRAPVRAGDAVAIFGIGGLGVHAVQIARIRGASVIVAVDVADEPLARARQLGATTVVDARTDLPGPVIRSATDGGVDVAIECVGRPDSMAWAVEALRPGGVAALAGIGPDAVALPPTTIFARDELDVRGVYGYSMEEAGRVMRLIASAQLDATVAIGEVLPLREINVGLEHFRDTKRSRVRVIIDPQL